MWKNEKIANLEKTSDKILAIIEEKPKSQKEIFNQLRPCLDKEKQNIRWKVIHDHLKRLVHSRKIGYFGNKVNKLHTKILLREKYGLKGWPEDSQQVYIYTPEAGKLFNKLIKKYKRKNFDLIDEITRLYQVIEITSKFQSMYSPKKTKLRKDITRFYNERNKRIKFTVGEEQNKFLKIIKMTPEMHWIAYREEKIKNELTFPMFAKMLDLFNRVKASQTKS